MRDDEIKGTGALLVNAAGQYLLHLRDDIPGICDPGAWSLIGGNREPGEGLEETIQRELWEEAELVVPALKRFTVVGSTGPDGVVKGFVQVFRGRWDGDVAGLPLSEGIMLHWFEPEIVPRLRMSQWAQEAIRRDRACAPV
ncbi:NUDIX hydrolase [Streptomyces jumonjinensis]|uniref:NUDIX hydrolase n=1 Tax=Streptomyces jumonjinensis TaxID=1945 RepID=A0A646KA74_STRJU|nr:NUDIX hydrolase [Streptomyces jumonjinensis]MQS99104.1 NUDIX hydrolase [Streptomyces jumonjinensis]